MNAAFDPHKLGGSGVGAGSQRTQRPRAERVFMEVETYETPADGFHYAVGRRIDSDPGADEQVRVRLTTVKERLADRADLTADKVTAQYSTGQFHRETIADKEKSNIRLIAFDDAYRIGTDSQGVAEYRAHWPKTIATNPEAEVLTGLGHIRLREQTERAKPQAYVELVRDATAVDSSTIDRALTKALAIKDDQNRARDPFLVMRVFYEGRQVAAPRIYPDTAPTKVFDQSVGDYKEVARKVDAAATIAKVMNGARFGNELSTVSADAVRAVVAGLKGGDEPNMFATQERDRAKALNLYHGAKQGALQVEIVAMEKIDFGADSRMTYLKDKDRPHLAAYSLREPASDSKELVTPLFAKTLVAVQRHTDGEPYAVYASPEAMYPKDRAKKLADLPMLAPVDRDLLLAERAERFLREQSAAENLREPALAADDDDEPSFGRYEDDDGPAF